MNNTKQGSVTTALIKSADVIEILSGEGEEGTVEDYNGWRSARAVRAALADERCNGDRWAILIVDGQRIT